MRRFILSLILLHFFIPFFALAQNVSITEIMYDAEGTDSGREWIEIYNNTGADVDILKYKFIESNSAHSINKVSGDGIVSNKSYAIIAENPEKFSIDFPNVKKEAIYDASFSLSNSVGENLSLKDEMGSIVFSVNYDTTIGANGDGQSLQYNVSDWASSIPTPLSDFVHSVNKANTSVYTDNVSNTKTEAVSLNLNTTTTRKDPSMKFVFEGPKSVIVGQQNEFKAMLYGYSGEVISNGKFVWNFGDGTTLEQSNLMPVNHVYGYTGTYVISCSYKNNWINKTIFVGKTSVDVVSSPFVINEFYKFPFPAVKITNNSNTEYDMYGYNIVSNMGNFSIQEGTFIGGKDEIVIRLPTGEYDESSIKLVDPFGNVISLFKSLDNTNTIKEVPVFYQENKPVISGVHISASLGNTNEPILQNPIIEIEDKDDAKVDNTKVYLIFGLILLISVLIVFLINKNQNNATDSTDEYTLQDE
jgi:hypothetical protein